MNLSKTRALNDHKVCDRCVNPLKCQSGAQVTLLMRMNSPAMSTAGEPHLDGWISPKNLRFPF